LLLCSFHSTATFESSQALSAVGEEVGLEVGVVSTVGAFVGVFVGEDAVNDSLASCAASTTFDVVVEHHVLLPDSQFV
jgi:hypothetical protein